MPLAVEILLLAFHLLCVNVATAGPLVCMWLEWKEGRGDRLSGRVGRYLLGSSLALYVLGMGLGALMMWLQTDIYNIMATSMPKKVMYGVWELLFSLVLLAACIIWWRTDRVGGWRRWTRIVLLLLAGTNLMYHFPFLFLVAGRFVGQNNVTIPEIDAAAFRLLMVESDILSRVIHFWLASAASVGVMLIGYALRLAKETPGEPEKEESGEQESLPQQGPEAARRVAIWGGWIGLIPTLLQLPVGMWLMLKMPEATRRQLMGGDMVATALLTLGMLAALFLMHQFAAIARGKTGRGKLITAMGVFTVIVVMMTAMLLRAKSAANSAPPDKKEAVAAHLPASLIA